MANKLWVIGKCQEHPLSHAAKSIASYVTGEYRSDGVQLGDVLVAIQTTYVDICLKRNVDVNVFRFNREDQPRKNFKKVKPAGESVGG